MAVATGISPAEILNLDGRLFDELELAAAEHWSPELELLAVQCEVTHALYRAYVGAHSKKGAKLPPPLQIPRPGSKAEPAEQPAPTTQRLSPLGAARALFRGGRA
jgi:hypothetical protein